jgi:CRISPR/Cas system CMR subunit Cmr6 (Cas7 group RAMP superfamily)
MSKAVKGKSENPKELESIANDFNNNWRKSIPNLRQQISNDNFNENMKSMIIHDTLKQILGLYKEFLKQWDQSVKSQSSITPIGFQTVLVELKKILL